MKPKIKLIFTAFLCSISSVLIAQPVNVNAAKAIAEHHLAAISGPSLKSAGSKGRNFQFTSVKATVENKDTLYYILNDTINKGFVIVSADKRAWPILGYSTEGSFNEKKQPEAFTAWMESRKKEIESIKKNNLQPDSATTTAWQNLNLKSASTSSPSVEPLIKTQWDQGCYYNEKCPASTTGQCGHAYAGCTITAMAQIMKYWNYPTKGTGTHSYNNSTFGNLSADFGATTYQWTQMPNSVTSQNDAVATLMYHCGVSLDAEYGPSTTSAFNPRDGLVKYFNYSSNALIVNRSGFTTSEWVNLLKSELDLRHPIWYTGSGGSVGHSFICDGYQDADYFHFNWGWSGSSDGYFYLGNLNPDWYSFNENQSVLLNLVPENLPDGYNGFFLSSNVLDIATKGGTTSVDVCSSTNWTASSDQSWLSLNTNTGISGKTTLTLTVTENQTGTDRSAKVTISAAGFGTQTIIVNQLTKVNVTPGGLKKIMSQNATTITKLTLSGTMDARDFKTMRDAMPALTDVDLSEVNIVAYSGTEGPRSPDYETYPANEIPANAFPIASCIGQNHFKSFILPTSIASIGSYSFYNCKFLTSINILASVTNIGLNAFGGCNALINVDPANPNYSSIDGVLFDKNQTNIIHCPISKTGNYTIPSSVTSIVNFAFESCEKLSGITIPKSVASVEELAFTTCSASINVDVNNPNFSGIDGVLFNKEQTKLIHCPISKTGSYIIPSSVVSIERYAFEHCGLENVTIPSSVIFIGDYAFLQCLALKTVSVSSSVTSFGNAAFYSCKALSDLTIPLSVARIEMDAFNECVNLRSVHCNIISPINFTSYVTVFRNVNKSTCTLYVPYGSKDAYQSANQWKDFTNIVEMPGIFLSNNKISLGPGVSTAEVVISSSSAWTATSDQTWLTAGASTGSSGKDTNTFTATENPTATIRSATITISATGLTPQTIKVTQYGKVEVTAGNLKTILAGQLSTTTSLTLSGTIDARDFKTMRDEMPVLTNIDLSRVQIASYYGNEGTIDTGNNLYPANGVPNSAFYNQNTYQGKSGLKSVLLPLTANTIGVDAFSSCTDLTTIDIPLSVTSIEGLAFDHCTGLSIINIPASVNSIAFGVFGYFNGKITVDENNLTYSAIDGVLFNKNRTELIQCPISKTGEYTISPSVNIVHNDSFGFCRGLTKITIPTAVKTIGQYAFRYCDSLNSIFAYHLIPVDLNSSNDVFFWISKNTCTLYVPYGSRPAYREANQWKDFTNIVEMPGFSLSATTATVKAVQGSSANIDISSDVTYSLNSDQTWLAVSPATGNGTSTLTFTATENSGNTLRIATVTVSATGVESQTITVTQEGKNTTGIDQLSIEPEFIVYPNPTTGKAKLVFRQIPANGIFITISDITGKNCFKQLIRENESWIDLSGNVPGIYIIKTDQENIKAQKVILK